MMENDWYTLLMKLHLQKASVLKVDFKKSCWKLVVKGKFHKSGTFTNQNDNANLKSLIMSDEFLNIIGNEGQLAVSVDRKHKLNKRIGSMVKIYPDEINEWLDNIA